MLVQVPESGGLPPAEGVVGNRHRNRHVDPDHADLHLSLEPAGRSTVAGEDRGAVRVRVGVDQVQALVEGVNAHDREHRPEDLVAVDGHVGGDVVEQGRAEEEALGRELLVTTVDDDRGPGLGALRHVGGHLVTVLFGDERPHVGAGLVARCDLQLRQPF